MSFSLLIDYISHIDSYLLKDILNGKILLLLDLVLEKLLLCLNLIKAQNHVFEGFLHSFVNGVDLAYHLLGALQECVEECILVVHVG